MSHLLREKGVLLLPHRPSSLNARPPPFTASLPAGRQCHHSAASSSARLNTGAKVQTAAGSREGSHLQTHAVAHFSFLGEDGGGETTSHVRVPSPFYTKSHSNHRGAQKSPAAKPWQRARALISMRQGWYLDGGLLGRPRQISLTPRLTHSGPVFSRHLR